MKYPSKDFLRSRKCPRTASAFTTCFETRPHPLPTNWHSYDVGTGKIQEVLPGLPIVDYEVSSDEQEVAFTTRANNQQPEIWLAFLDRRAPPRKITVAGDQVSFGPKGQCSSDYLKRKPIILVG